MGTLQTSHAFLNLFQPAISFNGSLGTCGTSKVVDLSMVFPTASKFNQPLDTWTTSSVTHMQYSLESATIFNQPLDTWTTSSVTGMRNLFDSATIFNKPSTLGTLRRSWAFITHSPGPPSSKSPLPLAMGGSRCVVGVRGAGASSVFAGSGEKGFAGDGHNATSTKFSFPGGLA